MKVVPLETVEGLRREYLSRLPQFQELYLELMVPTSKAVLLGEEDGDGGYALINDEGVLFEFYLRGQDDEPSSKILHELCAQESIRNIYCKSFDHQLFEACKTLAYDSKHIGCMFRDFIDPRMGMLSDVKRKLAELSDADFLLQQGACIDELFESPEQLHSFIRHEQVYLYFQKEAFAGCGTIIRVHTDWNYCDLGVWVHPDFRMKGVGTHIISSLRQKAIAQNMNPTCGCDTENKASQKTLEKSGYISRYQLLEFKVANPKKI